MFGGIWDTFMGVHGSSWLVHGLFMAGHIHGGTHSWRDTFTWAPELAPICATFTTCKQIPNPNLLIISLAWSYRYSFLCNVSCSALACAWCLQHNVAKVPFVEASHKESRLDKLMCDNLYDDCWEDAYLDDDVYAWIAARTIRVFTSPRITSFSQI